MKLETFFEKFDQFADAPDAVAKMRELVLELAVRGRLLSSCSPDSSAPSDPSRPFAIPQDWQWIALNKAADCRAAAKVDSASLNDSDWVLDLEDIDGGSGKVIATATFAERRSLSTKASFQNGDVLYGKLRPYLNKVVIADRPGFCTTEIIPLRPQKFVAAGYLRLFLRSPHFLRYAAAKNYGMKMPRLGTQDLESAAIPLPPLAEQKRIVAKVDELMALCDRLEAQQQERETRHAALARASLARFADAPTPANLPFLFHPSYAIPPADLRKSILTLAVQGKLVPQDPNDEPAASLISQIAEEKRRLVAARIIREKDEAAPIADDEPPFEVPFGWEWTRLSSITRRIHYGYTASAKSELKDVRLLRITDIQNNFVDWPSVPGCEIAKDEVAQYQLERSDILVARTGGTVGKTYLVQDVPVVAVFASYLIRIQGGSALFDRYLKLFLESPTYWVQLEEGARGAAQPNVNGQTLGRMVVSVPPLAEQRRIVAKVEQLMSLVDELEAQLAASRATAANLLSALVAELTAA